MLCYLVCQLADGFEAEETKVGIAQVGTFYILFSGNNQVYLFMKKKPMVSALIRFWSLLYLFCSIHYSIHYYFIFLVKEIIEIKYLYVLNVCTHQTYAFIISPTFIRDPYLMNLG